MHSMLTLAITALSTYTSQMVAEARRRHLDQYHVESILAQFETTKRLIRDIAIDWDRATSTTVGTFRTPALDGKAVRIKCAIRELFEPFLIEIRDDRKPDLISMLGSTPEDAGAGIVKMLQSHLTIAGERDETTTTLKFVDRQLIESIAQNMRTHALFEVLAVVVTSIVPSESESNATVKRFDLLPLDVRPITDAIRHVGPTPGELQAVDDRKSNEQHPLLSVVESLIRLLRIKSIDESPILREALEIQVLSAVSVERRIHTLLVGPPGVGKSLVTRAMHILQPISREIMATKVTEAGLIGIGSRNAKGYHAYAGIIPQADQGGIAIQDWHQANKVKNQRLCVVLTTAMQDGMVHDTSASRCSYQAQTAVLIDANRRSDVRRTGPRNVAAIDRLLHDINMPLNMVTRITYAAEIPREIDRQIQTLIEIIDGLPTSSIPLTEDEQREIRLLKVMMARLRERHPQVTIPSEVSDSLKDAIGKVVNVTRDRFEAHAEYGDFLIRLAEHAATLVQAHARLHNRGVATIADVHGVYPYLLRKMNFVRDNLFGATMSEADISAAQPGIRTLIQCRMPPGRHTAAQVRRRLCLTSTIPAVIDGELRALYGPPDSDGYFLIAK
jgi:hypothetical protein